MAKNLSSLVHELRERIAASSSTPPLNKNNTAGDHQYDDALEIRFRAVIPNLLHTYVVPSSTGTFFVNSHSFYTSSVCLHRLIHFSVLILLYFHIYCILLCTFFGIYSIIAFGLGLCVYYDISFSRDNLIQLLY